MCYTVLGPIGGNLNTEISRRQANTAHFQNGVWGAGGSQQSALTKSWIHPCLVSYLVDLSRNILLVDVAH